MSLLDSYTDLDGNVLSLSELKRKERRLITRLCRRAGRNPPWQKFEAFAHDAVDWFWSGAFFPLRELAQTAAPLKPLPSCRNTLPRLPASRYLTSKTLLLKPFSVTKSSSALAVPKGQ